MQTLAREVILALAQAMGGGLLTAAIAFVLCRFITRLTAPVRFWIWWFVGAKFLIGLILAMLGVSGVRVPVLKAEHFYTIQGLARKTVVQAGRVAPVVSRITQDDSAEQTRERFVTPFTEQHNADRHTVSTARRFEMHVRRTALASCMPLIGIYLAGVVIVLGRVVSGRQAMSRLVSDSPLCDHLPTMDLARAIANQMRLKCLPPIRISLRASTPFVTGLWKPSIVIPAALLADPVLARRMILAHELAHLKRHDLPLELVPVLVRTLFWFCPPVHLIVREIESAREEATDLSAIAVCEVSCATYATLLISVAERSRMSMSVLAMATPASRTFSQVRRRLRTLSPRRNWQTCSGALAVCRYMLARRPGVPSPSCRSVRF